MLSLTLVLFENDELAKLLKKKNFFFNLEKKVGERSDKVRRKIDNERGKGLEK